MKRFALFIIYVESNDIFVLVLNHNKFFLCFYFYVVFNYKCTSVRIVIFP